MAGKRVKCKCGQVMTVPAAAPGQEDDDGLYDFAPSSQTEVKKPKVPLAPLAPRTGQAEPSLRQGMPSPTAGVAAAAVGYRSAPVKKDHFTHDTLMDMKRDVHVPVGLLIAGFAIYLFYYVYKYEVSGAGIAAVMVGVSLITLIKAILLIGFALMVAGPLGVSFGGIWTAVLKLAAITVFCDGMTTWVEEGMVKLAGPGGALYGGIFVFFVAIGVYWLWLIYLFSMDPGDSWMVVCLLAVFDYICKWVLLILLLATVLNWGGVAAPAVGLGGGGGIGGGGGGGTPSSAAAEQRQTMRELKEQKQLEEAKEFIAGGRQAVFTKAVNEWYEAGAPNVWFEVSRDFNGKPSPDALWVELPKDKDKRAKCFQILNQWEKENQGEDPDLTTDTELPYIVIGID